MTRFSAAAVIFSLLAFFGSFPAIAQSDPSQCFPWQEFKNGTCVAKPSQAPPPLPPEAPTSAAPPCVDGTRSLSGQCTCPINMHLEGGRCTADASVSTPVAPAIAPAAVAPPVPPPLPQQATRNKPDEPMVCDGGSASNGRCVCPAGYAVMPPLGGGSGGTCVRTDAANCQGGELTVSGSCMCNRQVIMSGETYALEYSNGKCVPKRCPISTEMRDGKCISVSAVAPASTPEPEPKAKPKETKDADEGEHHRGCGQGMVRTHSGNCVVARRKMPAIAAPPGLSQYYRNYQFPGNAPSSIPQN
jgi:hypothetical protein